MISDRDRLTHILEAAEKITLYGKRDRNDEIVFDAIVRQLAVIGEAVRHLSPSLRKRYDGIPWKSIVGLRNLVIHEYFIVSGDRIWKIVDADIPQLHPKIRNIISSLSA